MSESVQAGPRPGEEAAAHAVAEAFRKHLPSVCGAMLSVGFSIYLLLPLYQPPETPADVEAEEKESYNLDCFLVRDASGSIDPQHYEVLEDEILGHLSTRGGDRISYSRFGSDIVSGGVPPPSDDEGAITAHRRLAQQGAHTVAGTTDFERLFDRLRKAIQNDRERQRATKRKPHADAIIILSDGIPDLTPDQESCPDSGREFISDEIVEAYDAMINSHYATREAIYVRLILVGAPSECGPEIQSQWERRLSARGLEVLAYSATGGMPGLGERLLTSLRRHPKIFFQISGLKDEQRRRMDRGERFSVQFTAHAFRAGGTVRVESASLVGQGGSELDLHALRNSQVSSTKDGHNPVFAVPSPEPSALWGPSVDQEEFYLEPESSFVSLESETYRLLVKASVLERPGQSVEIDPVEVRPCHKAGQKSRVRERLKLPVSLSVSLAAIFLLGSLSWYVSPKGNARSWLEDFFVVPYRRWLYLFLLLFLPVFVGVVGLQKPWPIACCVVLILCFVLFLLEGFRKSPAALLIFRVVEFAALPLVAEVAAQYLT